MQGGKNVFITGIAGCGKTFLLNYFRNQKQARVIIGDIGFTSTTGISAMLINGSTVHSFLGIGLGIGSVEDLYFKVKNNARIKKRWMQLKCLIIDEISMMSSELLIKLE